MTPIEQGFHDGATKANQLRDDHGLSGLARRNWRHEAAKDGGAQQHGFRDLGDIETYYRAYVIGAMTAVEEMT